MDIDLSWRPVKNDTFTHCVKDAGNSTKIRHTTGFWSISSTINRKIFGTFVSSVFLKRTLWSLLISWVFATISYAMPVAFPKLVTYTFTGVIAPSAEVFPDETFTGSISIDPRSPRYPHEGCCWAQYFPYTSLTFNVGGRTWYKSADSGRCDFGVWRSNAGTTDIFDLSCGASQLPNPEDGSMSAWWRFENYPTDTVRDWDIPLGPFAPDEFQGGAIFGEFNNRGEIIHFRGSLQLTGVNVTSEPGAIWILCVGLFGLVIVHKRKINLKTLEPKIST